MDTIDRKLLIALQNDAAVTQEQLAFLAGASLSSVQRRIRRLRETGLIAGIRAELDPASAGFPHLFVVGLEIERKNPALYSKLKAWIRAEDAIQQAYNVTGSSDFILVIAEESLESYDALMSMLVEANPNVRKFETHVVLQTFKRGLKLPLQRTTG